MVQNNSKENQHRSTQITIFNESITMLNLWQLRQYYLQ